MFLKKYTQLSAPKLLEQLNGNVHYQIFCDIWINPLRPLKNYKLIDDIAGELSDKLKIQQQQDILAEAKKTEILYIFFGIHTANLVHLAERLAEQDLVRIDKE